jgi:hypothetical protein
MLSGRDRFLSLCITEPQPHWLALARVAMLFAQKSHAALIALDLC